MCLSLFSFFVIFSSILNFLNSWHYFKILLISNILSTIGRECPCFYMQMVYVKTSEATTPLETLRLLDVIFEESKTSFLVRKILLYVRFLLDSGGCALPQNKPSLDMRRSYNRKEKTVVSGRHRHSVTWIKFIDIPYMDYFCKIPFKIKNGLIKFCYIFIWNKSMKLK